MANIDIEKKDKNNNSSMWLWIVGILVLAGVIWWIASADDEPKAEGAEVYEQRISGIFDAVFPEDETDWKTEIGWVA